MLAWKQDAKNLRVVYDDQYLRLTRVERYPVSRRPRTL